MKKYPLLVFLFFSMSTSNILFSMQVSTLLSITTINIIEKLSPELIVKILSKVLISSKATEEATDIHEGLKHIKRYMRTSLKNISLTCSFFLALKSKLIELKPYYLDFYRKLLADQFLEQKTIEDLTGLYPINDHWIPLNGLPVDTIINIEKNLAHLIYSGTDVTNRLLSDISSLHTMERIKLQLARIALIYGANIDSLDEKGNSALINFSSVAQLKLLKALLAFGANPTIMNNQEENLLYHLVLHNNLMGIKELLKYGTPVITAKKPLLLLILKNNTEDRASMVKILLTIPYMNIYLKDEDGHTARDTAVSEGLTEIIELLDAYCPIPSLKTICLLFIKNRKEQYKKQFVLLPQELAKEI